MLLQMSIKGQAALFHQPCSRSSSKQQEQLPLSPQEHRSFEALLMASHPWSNLISSSQHVQPSTAGMPRNQGTQQQQQQAAVVAARTLQTLLSSSSVSQLLRQPLPARPLTAAEAADVASCCKVVSAVEDRFNAARSQQPDAEVLAAVLQQQAAFKAGTLLSWVLRQPQQLQLSELPARFEDVHTPEALLRASSTLLKAFSGALPHKNGSSTARTMLQQLERSGDDPSPCTFAAQHLRE
jgi:hypothetical protein